MAIGSVLVIIGVVLLVWRYVSDGSTSFETYYVPFALIVIGLSPQAWRIGFGLRQSFDRELQETRDHLSGDDLPRVNIKDLHGDLRIDGTIFQSRPASNTQSRASIALQQQEAILREIYTQGLVQAKISFRVSIIFASIGAAFLLLGVGLAIMFADTTGERYASIVAGVAGTVIDVTSSVFFSNQIELESIWAIRVSCCGKRVRRIDVSTQPGNSPSRYLMKSFVMKWRRRWLSEWSMTWLRRPNREGLDRSQTWKTWQVIIGP
jgi:hypothetical protein